MDAAWLLFPGLDCDHPGHDRENRVLRPLVSATTEPGLLGSRTPLFHHALRLHQQNPDSPLPHEGQPYPDDDLHLQRHQPQTQQDPRLRGIDAAAILDRHFGNPHAAASELTEAFHDVEVPTHPNEHITAAALRADRQRVQHTGRWLVRHSPDRCSAIVGLALLATDRAEEDIPLIQTIGLLSNTFGLLAATALERRHGREQALLWLAQRVTGSGRIPVIESLCRHQPAARRWLLRHACDGDIFDGYYAGQVATSCHLHQAITSTETDDDLIDHTGRLLGAMADSFGMGMTLEHYPPAPIVLSAHATHLGQQAPTVSRYLDAGVIAFHLTNKTAEHCGCTAEQRDHIVQQYLTVLNRQQWYDAVRENLDQDNRHSTWFLTHVATRLRLHAFTDLAKWRQ